MTAEAEKQSPEKRCPFHMNKTVQYCTVLTIMYTIKITYVSSIQRDVQSCKGDRITVIPKKSAQRKMAGGK